MCNGLGYHLNAIGDLSAARPYYEQALAIRRQVLGDQHPDTATSLWWMGHILMTEGKLVEAQPYYEQAFAIYLLRLGPNHPDTQAVRSTLEQLKAEQSQ